MRRLSMDNPQIGKHCARIVRRYVWIIIGRCIDICGSFMDDPEIQRDKEGVWSIFLHLLAIR